MANKNDFEQGMANIGDKIGKVKDLLVRLVAEGARKTGRGLEQAGDFAEDKLAQEQIVLAGFIDKCAELGVDPKHLIKLSLHPNLAPTGDPLADKTSLEIQDVLKGQEQEAKRKVALKTTSDFVGKARKNPNYIAAHKKNPALPVAQPSKMIPKTIR